MANKIWHEIWLKRIEVKSINGDMKKNERILLAKVRSSGLAFRVKRDFSLIYNSIEYQIDIV